MTQAATVRAALARAAARPYRHAGFLAWRFAQGKLDADPAYAGILEHGLIPDCGRLLDLGCGQGLLAAWLAAARKRHATGDWPRDWPAPPRVARYEGIDLMPADVDRARRALAATEWNTMPTDFAAGDIRETELGRADVAVILDVLHYMDYAAQESVLRRVRAALGPSGTLLLRVGDAQGGWRFRWSRWVDHAVTFARGHRLPRLYCRPLPEWTALLADLGFVVTVHPMSSGTLFANVLLAARLAARSGDPVARHQDPVEENRIC